jgi:hypothetical protein
MTTWQWLIVVAFLAPAGEGLAVSLGEWWFHVRFRTNGHFKLLIVQVTTTGREADRVNQIIDEVRNYQLSMPYEVWVVNEPGLGDQYASADRVLTVDPEFECRAQYKARALEYSRRFRGNEGLARADVKILFLDDDTSPTRPYIETAFAADYDICQGVTAPRFKYGALPWRHFLLSHMDDMRFLACLVYCSLFQGVLRWPLYVHGEGLCVTGAGEALVTWDYPIFASEDLVFGHHAAALGMRWGFFHEYIELTSPWTWGAYLKQRRRWLWGNVYAMVHGILPRRSIAMVAARYFFGFATYCVAVAAVILLSLHVLTLSPLLVVGFWASLIAWLAAFGLSGWVNASRHEPNPEGTTRRFFRRIFQAAAAVVLCPLTATWTVVGLVVALFMGNPGRFEVIAKTASTAR